MVKIHKLQLLLLFCMQISVINCAQEDVGKKRKREWKDQKVYKNRNFNKHYPGLAEGFQLTGLNFQDFMTEKLAGHYSYERITLESGKQTSRLDDAIEQAEKTMVIAMQNQLKNGFDQAVQSRTSLDLPSANILKYAHSYKESFGDEILQESINNKDLLSNEVKNGQISTVKQLLDCGADVNVLSSYGSAPLHYAADLGGKKTMTLLLDRDAKIDIQDKYGKTPLFIAVAKSDFGVVEKLTDKGADVDFISNDGLTPLGYSMCYCSKMKVINLLIKKGASNLGKHFYKISLNEKHLIQKKIAKHNNVQLRQSLPRKAKDKN